MLPEGSGTKTQPELNLVHFSYNVTFGGNKRDDFLENQTTKFRTVYSIKTICRVLAHAYAYTSLLGSGHGAVSYTHLTLPTNREV